MKNSDDSGYTGKHVGVCVLDTGIFPHIDFTGRILAFQDFIGHRIRPYDDNSHGTHVCGIIGGDGRASEGRIRGIAPGCSLIVLKVLDRTGNGRKEDVLQAFRWILENKRYYGIRVVNISVGTTFLMVPSGLNSIRSIHTSRCTPGPFSRSIKFLLIR